MDKTVDHVHSKTDRHSSRKMDEISKLIKELSLASISELEPILDMNCSHKSSREHPLAQKDSSHKENKMLEKNKHNDHKSDDKNNSRRDEAYLSDLRSISDRVNNLCDSLSRNLITYKEFIELMEQIKKDKEVLEETYRKSMIKHRVEDYQGMLSIFEKGSQAFLATKVAISQLNSLL